MAIIGLNGFFAPLALMLFGAPSGLSELVIRDHAPIFINSATAECMHASNAVFAHFRGDIRLRFAERDGGVLIYVAGEKTCALGKNEKQEDISTRRQEILAQLSRGEINVQEATKLLSQLKGDLS